MHEVERGGVKFLLDDRPGDQREKSDASRFVMVKTVEFIEFYERLRTRILPSNVVELGLFEGGSFVYVDKLFSPNRLVGIELHSRPHPALDDYMKDNPHVSAHFGISQDSDECLEVVANSFSGPLDLVIDDASHQYQPTKASFEMLFPLLREGGVYVVEDWGWAHYPQFLRQGAIWAEHESMSKFLFELQIMMPTVPAIADIYVTGYLFAITKGPGDLPETGTCIEGLLRGGSLGHF